MNELAPRVSVDPTLGQYVTDCNVDYDALVSYMQSRGISDEDIASTNIVVSAEQWMRKRWSFKEKASFALARQGRFDKKSGTIHVYPAGYLEDSIFMIGQSQKLGIFNAEEDIDYYSDLTGGLVNMVMRHEIEHHALQHDPQVRGQNCRHTARSVARLAIPYAMVDASAEVALHANEALGSPIDNLYIVGGCIAGLALATTYVFKSDLMHKEYFKNPEEKLCRQAETATDTPLISLQLKPQA